MQNARGLSQALHVCDLHDAKPMWTHKPQTGLRPLQTHSQIYNPLSWPNLTVTTLPSIPLRAKEAPAGTNSGMGPPLVRQIPKCQPLPMFHSQALSQGAT